MEINFVVGNERRKAREKIWQKYESAYAPLISDGQADLISARREWFIGGNLAPLIEIATTKGLEFSELEPARILELCPLNDVDLFCDFAKSYSIFYSDFQLGWWGNGTANRNESAINLFTNKFSGLHNGDMEEVYGHFLVKLLPTDGVVVFPFSLGKDDWIPSHEINTPSFVRKVLATMFRYLYLRDDNICCGHITKALHFVEENISSIDGSVFNADYLEGDYYSPSGEYVNRHAQSNMRELLACLNGYDVVDFSGEKPKCFDVDFEKELKRVFELAEMPESYYSLLEFIHEHKEDCA